MGWLAWRKEDLTCLPSCLYVYKSEITVYSMSLLLAKPFTNFISYHSRTTIRDKEITKKLPYDRTQEELRKTKNQYMKTGTSNEPVMKTGTI